jgi:hypothetical protein
MVFYVAGRKSIAGPRCLSHTDKPAELSRRATANIQYRLGRTARIRISVLNLKLIIQTPRGSDVHGRQTHTPGRRCHAAVGRPLLPSHPRFVGFFLADSLPKVLYTVHIRVHLSLIRFVLTLSVFQIVLRVVGKGSGPHLAPSVSNRSLPFCMVASD